MKTVGQPVISRERGIAPVADPEAAWLRSIDVRYAAFCTTDLVRPPRMTAMDFRILGEGCVAFGVDQALRPISGRQKDTKGTGLILSFIPQGVTL